MTLEEEKAKVELELEKARSKVRRICTYAGIAVVSFLVIYGVVWMGDRSAFIAGISIFGSLIGFWFGNRGGDKTTEQIVQAINKLK